MVDKNVEKEISDLKKAVDSAEDRNYFFTFEKKNGVQIVANGSDDFIHSIVKQMLIHHPDVMKKVVADLMEAVVEMMIFDKLEKTNKH